MGISELLLVLFVILLFMGPDRVRDLARKLGEAYREFRLASESAFTGREIEPEIREQLLLEAARELGVDTEGKTIDQIAVEVLKKAKELGIDLEKKD